jgi:hypothetical protein
MKKLLLSLSLMLGAPLFGAEQDSVPKRVLPDATLEAIKKTRMTRIVAQDGGPEEEAAREYNETLEAILDDAKHLLEMGWPHYAYEKLRALRNNMEGVDFDEWSLGRTPSLGKEPIRIIEAIIEGRPELIEATEQAPMGM